MPGTEKTHIADKTSRISPDPVGLDIQVAVVAGDGRILATNRAWQQSAMNFPCITALGFQVGIDSNHVDLCRSLDSALSHEETIVAAGVRNVLLGKEFAFKHDYRCVLSDGKEHRMSLRVTPFQNAERGIIITHIDMTDQEQSKQFQRESEDRLRAILDASADAMVTIDCKGLIVNVNKSTEKMFGYSEAELIGANVSILMPLPYREEHDRYIARYLSSRESHIIGVGRELIARRKDGTIFPIELHVSEVDHREMFTGIIHDISLRKELHRQVIESAMEEQRRLSEELHDNIGQELTALTLFASSYLELLDESAVSIKADSRSEWLSKLRGIATKISTGLANCSRDVRSLARGLFPNQIEVDGLQSALDELAHSVSDTGEMGVRLVTSGSIVLADQATATHLFRIAQEAVHNAVKHSRARCLTIMLREHDGHLTMIIEDDGIGFDVQAETGGAGLGLRLMHHRAGEIGAILDLQSWPRHGTIVRCMLPRHMGKRKIGDI